MEPTTRNAGDPFVNGAPAVRRRPSALAARLVISAVMNVGAATAVELTPGFTYCAPPYRPPCVAETVQGKSMSACDEEAQAYIASVFRYRECLEAESERAVREANETVEAWKCKRSRKECRR
jgi:hypothetical protein